MESFSDRFVKNLIVKYPFINSNPLSESQIRAALNTSPLLDQTVFNQEFHTNNMEQHNNGTMQIAHVLETLEN